MAETTIAELPIGADPVRGKKGKSRKALKQKSTSSSDANILAGTISETSPAAVAPLVDHSAGKENHDSLSQPKSARKTKAATKSKQQSNQSFEKELQEMQDKLQQLRLEKEKTEEQLKAKDEMLQLKEEELETRGREQEKLQMELKKLQKLKEFKPTMVYNLYFPFLIGS